VTPDRVQMSNTTMLDINRAITDGTFIEFMKTTATYTTERQELYDRWKMLNSTYKELEFRLLLKICQV
jgi:hypothetical protein